MPRPNLILLITDQQRAPQHWPTRPGLARRADAERRRAAPDRHQLHARLHRDRDVLAEPGELPDRHVSVAPRRDAHADRGRPVPRPPQPPRRAAHGRAAGGAAARFRARRLARAFLRGLLRLGPKSGNEPELPRGHRHARHPAARARLPRGAQGQVAPVEAGRRAALERRRPGADRARLRLRRLGAARRRRRREGRDVRRRQRRHRRSEGWDEDYTRQMERWLGSADLPEPFCLVFSLVNPHDVLGYPSSYEERRLPGRRSSPASACRCRRPSTRTCATSRPCTR